MKSMKRILRPANAQELQRLREKVGTASSKKRNGLKVAYLSFRHNEPPVFARWFGARTSSGTDVLPLAVSVCLLGVSSSGKMCLSKR